MSAFLFVLIFFPMLAAGVSFVIGRFGKTARSVFAAAVCAAMLAVSLVLFFSGQDLSVSVTGRLKRARERLKTDLGGGGIDEK